jgi:hypothetical protein
VTAGSGATRDEVAYHEAGHAVLSHRLRSRAVIKISIADDGRQTTYADLTPLQERYLLKADLECRYGGFVAAPARRWVEGRLMVILAGDLAQWKSTGHATPDGYAPSAGDETNALSLAQKVSSSSDEARAYAMWLVQRTWNMLCEPTCWSAVRGVADQLLTRETLSRRQFSRIVRA